MHNTLKNLNFVKHTKINGDETFGGKYYNETASVLHFAVFKKFILIYINM